MEHYKILASLFDYPGNNNLQEIIPHIKKIILEKYPASLDKIDDFEIFANKYSPDSQNEYYIRTFDVQALCYLDIGYVLFGEDYKRGEFLVNMRNEHIKAGNNCGCELADHLPNILRLLHKIEDKKFAQELAYSIVIPSLKLIINNFKDESNYYKSALELLLNIMENDFCNLPYKQFRIMDNDKTDFLNRIDCMSCSPGH